MDFKKIISMEEYSFLRKNPDLNNNILLLTLGGSYSYGTNVEGSDIDLRGIAYNRTSDLLGFGLDPFVQTVDENTDTTIYSLNRIINLLTSCNPNTIEMLGCRPEHYLILNKDGEMLLKNRKLFLSKRAIGSFGGYAGQQLNRMLNALARETYEQREREEHILRSLKSAMNSFNERYSDFGGGYINLFIGASDKENLETEIRADIKLSNYPLRDFNGMLNELGYKDIEQIIVHCGAGVSRSAGVCAAIMKYLTGDDSEIFDNPKYCPNMTCYRTVLNGFYSPKEEV